jgi:hypothetical protein
MNKDYKIVISMSFNKTITTTLIILSLANTGCSTVPTVKEAAVLDTVTTAAVLGTKTGYELNPAGFMGATLFKAFILNYVVDKLEPQAQEYFNRAAATIWTAAAVNNLGILAGIAPQIALPLTLAAGYAVYVNTPVLTEENINGN